MKLNEKNEYLLLDGVTPYIVAEDGQPWWYNGQTQTWEKDKTVDFEAVYPNRDGWWKYFENLPELPTAET